MRYSKDEMLENRIRALRAALLRIADTVPQLAASTMRGIAIGALRADTGGFVTHAIHPSGATLCGDPRYIDWDTGRHRGIAYVADRRTEINCSECLQRSEGTPIGELGYLAARIENVLRHERIVTIEHADSLSDQEWMLTPNFGRKSLRELRGAIEQWRGRQHAQLACAEMILGG